MHSPFLLTYGGNKRSKDEKTFLYRSLFLATVLLVTCWYTSVSDTPAKLRVLDKQLDRLSDHHHRLSRLDSEPIKLHYNPDPPDEYPWERSSWTLDDFAVNGVNLAAFGTLREEFPLTTVTLEEYYELYEDFSLGVFLTPGESHGHHSVYHLLMFHRQLEHTSLAFYMDAIAQKRHLRHIGIPIPQSRVLKYVKEFDDRDTDEVNLRKLLPQQADFVVKPAQEKMDSAILVSYDDGVYKMGSDPEHISEDYKVDQVVDSLVQNMYKGHIHPWDHWSNRFVPPGIVVEDRFTAFDSHLHAPLRLSVYVIWGQVWMAEWHRAEEHPNMPRMVFRNGTVVEDQQRNTMLPRWAQWDGIVEQAQDLAAHKDFYQINFEVGVPAATAKLLNKATREEQMKHIQVVVSQVLLNPVAQFPNDLMNEMGRLWVAGYQMGIYKEIPNYESMHYMDGL